MLSVACVCVGEKYAPAYVFNLRRMVARHLRAPHEFLCLTDRPERFDGLGCIRVEHRGWWSKIELFKPGRFPWRVLYLDLDVVVTGPLDELAARDGIIRDWHLPGFNSSVMSWRAGDRDQVYERLPPDAARRYAGDQDWITEAAPDWPTWPEGWCVSYRSHAVDGPPAGARVVCFHGLPKPADLSNGWAPGAWAGMEEERCR